MGYPSENSKWQSPGPNIPFGRRVTTLLLAGLVMLITCGCAVQSTLVQPPPAVTGSFGLYLQPLPHEAHPLHFSITALAALREDGSEIPLALAIDRIAGGDLLEMQKKLATAALPPGVYQGFVLQVAEATLLGEEGEINLLAPEEPLRIDYQFTIMKDKAETLFLSLAPERLVTDGVLFTPKFSLWEPERLLPSLKGFASNSGSDSLTIFNKRTARITGSLHIGAMPKGLALDQRKGWLYVALARENAIAVVEVSNGVILGKVRLQFGDEPCEVVLSPSGNTLVAINQGSNSASIIDTDSLFEKGKIRLSATPTGVFMGPDEGRAYVLQGTSGAISVLDLAGLKVTASKEVEEFPVKGTTNVNGAILYLISDFSANLLVVDAATLAVTSKIFIGQGAVSIKADKKTGLLYIGMQDGAIAVVDPRSALMLIDSFTLEGTVRHLTIDNEENAFFAVLPHSNRLQKIDLVSKQPLASLELEKDSHAVAVMGER
ncbi:MAG: YncE family protein [Deltaproteobacteria bacterium]|nr:YncE family protein [Deltaproteobacteria bacterium]